MDYNHLYTWEHFKDLAKPVFDIVFVDIRPVNRRVDNFDSFFSYLSENGVLIYDDYHKPHLRKPLQKKIRKIKGMINAFNLYELTLDSYGRFALWIEKNE